MKKDLAYYEKGIKEGSIIDLKGLKPGDAVYKVYGICNGAECPFNGYHGDIRCNGAPENCRSYVERVTFDYSLIPMLDKSIFKSRDRALKVRDTINSKRVNGR